MSIVRNVALFARPISGPVSASISSTVNWPSASSSSVRAAPYIPIRLAMNPGVSRATTTPLPSPRSAKRAMRSATPASVSAVGMISSSWR